MNKFFVTAFAVIFAVTPALSAEKIENLCERPNVQVTTYCDVLGVCWDECVIDGRVFKRTLAPETQTNPDPNTPNTPKKGNPGNTKNVGNAGEKGMDNESDRSGTRGNSNGSDRDNKGKGKNK